jgi:hypothetical protein
MIATDSGEARELTATYLAQHVEHAYAITGHSSQGATITSAILVGRPEEFIREWAYTALSRARQDTTIHLIADHGPPGPANTWPIARLGRPRSQPRAPRPAGHAGQDSGTLTPRRRGRALLSPRTRPEPRPRT